ncbi:HAAS signaling domain-containing protein [Streptomyces sp. NPDC003719]
MSTGVLTERYVHEVVRRLPADQRDDMAQELRATIADTIDGRGDDDLAAAEREVLSELGDPVRYAARYTERPLALIGPDLYPAYMRVLGTLLATVLPALALGLALLEVADGGGVGAALRVGAGTLLGVGAQLVAAVTVVFAVNERIRHRRGTTGDRWTPDELPDAPRDDRGGFAALAAVAWDVLLFALIVWQHTAEPYRADGGAHLEVLDPDLWSGWIWPVLAGLAGLAVVGVARVAGRGWNVRLAGWYALAHAAFTLPLAWVLYRQELFNPDFLADAETLWESQESAYSGAAAIVLAIGVTSVYKAFRAALR